MYTDKDIPAWDDKSAAGIFAWWHEMAAKGLAHHPDDDPESIVEIESGLRLFDPSACSKLRHIHADMEKLHGDLIYDAGQEAIMNRLGWKESSSRHEWVSTLGGGA